MHARSIGARRPARLARAYGARIAVAPTFAAGSACRSTRTLYRRSPRCSSARRDLVARRPRRHRHARSPPRRRRRPDRPVRASAAGHRRGARRERAARALSRATASAVDASANALVVVAPPEDVAAMRAVIEGIDVRDPARRRSEAVQLRTRRPGRSRRAAPPYSIRPRASTAAPNRTLLIEAKPADLAQIRTLIAAIDTPPPRRRRRRAGRRGARYARLAARRRARDRPPVPRRARERRRRIGRARRPARRGRQGKALVALIDQPASGVRYTQVYRLRFVDARSVANLLARSFRDAGITVDAEPQRDLGARDAGRAAAHRRRARAARRERRRRSAGGPPVQQPR